MYTAPISWIIHVFHALIYNITVSIARLLDSIGRLSMGSRLSSPLHHRNRTWKIYIFVVFKPILLPKKKNTINWNTCIKETRKILKVIYTYKRLFLPSLNQLFNLQNKQFTCYISCNLHAVNRIVVRHKYKS